MAACGSRFAYESLRRSIAVEKTRSARMGDNVSKKGGARKSVKRKPVKRSPRNSTLAEASPANKRSKIARKPRSAPKAPLLYHPGRLIDSERALEEGIIKLIAIDPEIAGELREIGGVPPLRQQEPGFAGLVRIIVAQQVSTASATAIFKRVETILTPLTAETVAEASDDKLRACGLSSPKMRTLRALASAVVNDGFDLAGLGSLAAEEAHRALVAVKGIGPWTADVFLLFCLGHPDAFPAGDLAVQEAAKMALGLPERPNARELEVIAERWRPLRGIAARMLFAYYRAMRQRVGMALESV
jgi:DNA-3-methyladenine glycosylase II